MPARDGGGTAVRSRLRTRLAHLVLVLVGLVAVVYGLSLGGADEVRCRGEVMTPGSVCVKSDGSEGQTYEQRLATRRSARPVVAGVGLLVAGFGTSLLVADVRRGRTRLAS
ncbi:hypothetical protein [Microlunatus flavus]|uniref:Uncharacterized protein n=1 Tax=Microlunatus flavus TaxID=1036181 RepID=A0A1H9KKK9_9ACTN|nr:hypothetical protein [Microlunatus flavus]SEQ99686.1 hypothetical protein SAMN05421756_107259 [Microlunatus flavus]